MKDPGRHGGDVRREPSFLSSPVVQASVPALYAWAMTVAPTAFGKGGTTLAQFFALLAVTLVCGAVALEFVRTTTQRFAHPLLVWGMTLASSASFLAASPRALAAFDTTRSVAGILGWLLFALASAAPALRRSMDEEALAVKPLAQRKQAPRAAFGIILAITFLLAAILQSYGWSQEPLERAVLLRIASIVLSLALLALSTRLLTALEVAPDAANAPSAFRTTLRVFMTLLVGASVAVYLWLRA